VSCVRLRRLGAHTGAGPRPTLGLWRLASPSRNWICLSAPTTSSRRMASTSSTKSGRTSMRRTIPWPEQTRIFSELEAKSRIGCVAGTTIRVKQARRYRGKGLRTSPAAACRIGGEAGVPRVASSRSITPPAGSPDFDAGHRSSHRLAFMLRCGAGRGAARSVTASLFIPAAVSHPGAIEHSLSLLFHPQRSPQKPRAAAPLSGPGCGRATSPRPW
jgi:hypothetical protein